MDKDQVDKYRRGLNYSSPVMRRGQGFLSHHFFVVVLILRSVARLGRP